MTRLIYQLVVGMALCTAAVGLSACDDDNNSSSTSSFSIGNDG